jgi:diguanylate cyclase (GGDEF)-like protein/PAS domain S-box-containing protein
VSAVFDAAPIGVGVWSVAGELLHPNPVLCGLLGADRAELIGELFVHFLDPADLPGVGKLVDDVWNNTRNAFECDFRCRHPDGRDLWLRTHVHAVYGPGGRPEYLLSQIFSFLDGRADRQRSDHLSAASPALLWATDDQANPATGNDRVFEFLGLPAGSGELATALFETMHHDDFERVRPVIVDAVADRREFQFTGRSLRGDGQWRWLHHRARPVHGPDGTFTGYAGVSLDVTEEEQERRALEDVRRLFESVTAAGPLAVVRTDAVGRVVYANGRWARLVDDPDLRLTGLGWRSVLVPEHVDEVLRRGQQAVETKQPFVIRVRARDASVSADLMDPELDGRYWAELRVAPVFTPAGNLDGFVATIADITAEMIADARADQLAQVLDAGSDFLLNVERNGTISYVNHAAEEALGVHSPSASDDRPPAFLMDVLDADSFEFFHEVVDPVLVETGRWKGELTIRDAERREIPVSALALAHKNDKGRIETVSVVARDISDLKQAQWRMRQLATHDYLTGLPNRVMLYERMDQALSRYHRLGQTVALLYLDLDRFKPINDELGHHVGDHVLVVLSDRIHAVVRDTDTPARIGGDEFAVLIEGFEDTELLERVTRRLIDTISEPISVDGVTVQVGVSIGIVAADEGSADADSLLARADSAMYAAKAAGRGRFMFADGSAPDLDVRTEAEGGPASATGAAVLPGEPADRYDPADGHDPDDRGDQDDQDDQGGDPAPAP